MELLQSLMVWAPFLGLPALVGVLVLTDRRALRSGDRAWREASARLGAQSRTMLTSEYNILETSIDGVEVRIRAAKQPTGVMETFRVVVRPQPEIHPELMLTESAYGLAGPVRTVSVECREGSIAFDVPTVGSRPSASQIEAAARFGARRAREVSDQCRNLPQYLSQMSLEGRSGVVRASCLRLLLKLFPKDDSSRTAAVRGLADSDADVRIEAGRFLGPAASAVMSELLQSWRLTEEQAAAALEIRCCGLSRGEEFALCVSLATGVAARAAKAEAAERIARSGHGESPSTLATLLKAIDPLLVAAAASGLAAIDAIGELSALQAALARRDLPEPSRQRIKRAILKLQRQVPPNSVGALSASPEPDGSGRLSPPAPAPGSLTTPYASHLGGELEEAD